MPKEAVALLTKGDRATDAPYTLRSTTRTPSFTAAPG